MYAHGDTYNGQWQSDTMQGKGTMYYKDGSVYEGEWENGLVCDILSLPSPRLAQFPVNFQLLFQSL